MAAFDVQEVLEQPFTDLYSALTVTGSDVETNFTQNSVSQSQCFEERCAPNPETDIELSLLCDSKLPVVNQSEDYKLGQSSNCAAAAYNGSSSLGQKRKTEQISMFEDPHHISLHLYHLTLSKLLSSPPRRVEPPLQRSVLMRNTLKHLELGMFCHTPSKRIFLDLDESTALNNLHLSSEAPATPEPSHDTHTKFDQVAAIVTATLMDCEESKTSFQGPEMTDFQQSQFTQQLYSEVTNENTNNVANRADFSTPKMKIINSQHQEKPYSSSFTSEVDPASHPQPISVLASSLQTCSTESLEKSKLSSLMDVDYQSLINCSMDQYTLNEPSGKSSMQGHSHVDELDSIMQVLVGM